MKNKILTSLFLAIISAQPALATTDVKVGMSGLYFPFTFVKMNKLQGFEVDLWDEIGKRNDYNIEYVTASFSGLFGLLETTRIDTISNQISITPNREAKYLFSTPYVIGGAQITVKKGNESIKSIEDLKGKTVGVNLGSNFEQLLREKDNNNKINIKTYDAGLEYDVAIGRVDAFIMDRISAVQLIKKSPLPLQIAGEPFAKIESAFPFVNNERGLKLQKEVNEAILSMKKDGTLSDMSIKWLGVDVSK